MCPNETRGQDERTHLHIDFVTAQDNGDVLADALKVAVPVGHVFVGNPRGHIEHDDTALALDVVAVSQTTKFFLSGRVPYVKDDVTKVGVEVEGVDLDTKSSCSSRSVYELQSVEWEKQACGKSAEVCGTVNDLEPSPMYFFSNSPVIWRC